MLPPLLLDVHADHSVFDMCAAPGSKTAQILELMMSSSLFEHKRANIDIPKGFVVANDADAKRAFMLTHQMNRLNTANIVIINHMAQDFPSLTYPNVYGTDSRVLFDRIVCDVPCSSDAAIRKIPQKWQGWNTKDGASLHPIQSVILKRGIELLKVGGKMTYSTCSLNPVENESVVAAALKEFGYCIKVIDPEEMSDFRFMPGFTDWKVMAMKHYKDLENVQPGESYFDEYASYADVPNDMHGQIKQSMFPNEYSEEIRQ